MWHGNTTHISELKLINLIKTCRTKRWHIMSFAKTSQDGSDCVCICYWSILLICHMVLWPNTLPGISNDLYRSQGETQRGWHWSDYISITIELWLLFTTHNIHCIICVHTYVPLSFAQGSWRCPGILASVCVHTYVPLLFAQGSRCCPAGNDGRR